MDAYFIEYGYIGLFIAAFLAATLLPLGSEIVFVTLIALGFDPYICLIIASIGNSLGGMTNYFIGVFMQKEQFFKEREKAHKKIALIEKWFYKKGAIIAFFSFLPIIGDLIALVLGYLKANVYVVAISLTLGKISRYLVLMYGVSLFG